ncbi:MAG: hypothetical protein H5T64_00450 [Chloroflexi bacterium]|nr:hypothetical protein [Chloroflexota bacterium]
MMSWQTRKRIQTALVIILFLALTVILTYPMVTYFREAIPGPPWDGFYYLTLLHWFREALFERHVSPWFHPDIFYPFGYNLALSETTLSNVALGMPVNLLWGEVVAFNALMWLSFVLSGFGAYLLTYDLTGQRIAGLVSGVAFAFCAYRMQAMSSGWLPTVSTQWVPLTFLYVERTIRLQRRRDAVLAGLFYILNCQATWYYAYVLGLVLMVYVFVRLRPWRETMRNRRLWYCGLAFALTLLLMVPAAMPLIRLWGQRQMQYSLPEVDWLSTSLDDFFLPCAYHPLWGSLSLKWYNDWVPYYPWIVPGMAYPGLSVVVLAVLARRSRKDRLLWRALLMIAAVAFVLALGMTLHLRGERVYIPVPAVVERAFTKVMIALSKRVALNPVAAYAMPEGQGIYIPLPTFFLYLFLPFFNAMRDWTRFALVPAFALSILAGIGAGRLLATRYGVARSVLTAGLIGVVVVDLAAVPLPFGMSLVQPRPSDTWLAQQPGDFAIMQFPFRARAYAGPSLYGMVTHQKKVTYGSGLTFFPLAYAAYLETLQSFPSAESVSLLRGWGVRFILVGSTRYAHEWPAVEAGIRARADLKLVAVLDEPSVYVAYRPGPMTGRTNDLRWTADRVYLYEVLP